MSDINDKPKFKTFRDAQNIPKEGLPSISSLSSLPSSARIPSITSTPSATRQNSRITSQKVLSEISPTKDFQKVPNSVIRAIPTGLFKGKSKLIYDYLWSCSRGAILPKRTIKKSRKEIKDGAAIGSMVTVDAAIKHLEQIGLLKVVHSIGSLSGNEYEIFSPDETELGYASIASIASNTSLTQKVDNLDILKSGISRTTQNTDNKDTYEDAKTSFKTSLKLDDDLAIVQSFEKLNDAVIRTTGKGITRRDLRAIEELFELLITETDIARTRAKFISSYVPFAVENLRRRLYTQVDKPKTQAETKATAISADVGRYDPPDEPEALSLELRETVAGSMQKISEQQGREAIEIFKKSYTTEDWNFIKSRIVEKE